MPKILFLFIPSLMMTIMEIMNAKVKRSKSMKITT